MILLSMQEQHQKKITRRAALANAPSSNRLITRFGPVVLGDARLTAAADNYSRVTIKVSEQ